LTASAFVGNDLPPGFSIMTIIGTSIKVLLDLVYPPHCVLCEGSCERYFCPECEKSLERIESATCGKCGHHIPEVTRRSARCPSCAGKPLFFARAVAPCRYEGGVREMILRFKLAGHRALAKPLSELLIERLAEAGLAERADAVVPVPLHWRRMLSRGFNQSQLLSRHIAAHFGLPLLDGHLKRVVNTASQTTRSGAQRMLQLRGAFSVRRPKAIAGRTLLLIDDVMTTCATAAECSRELLDAGARKVYVATVARTMRTEVPAEVPQPVASAPASPPAPDAPAE